MTRFSGYVTGVTRDGSRLRFEWWLYESWRRGNVADPLLLQSLNECVRFYID